MKTNKHVVYTSVNFAYLGRALTLARSVKEHDPSIYFVLLLVEPNFEFTSEVISELLDCDGGDKFDEILTLNGLNVSQNNEFQNYTVVEMCTAVKGQAAVTLLNRKTSQFVTYLDPDLYFYSSLEQIRSKHSNSDVLLTPHLNHIPYLDNIIHNDEMAGVMRHGVFNLGFVSFRNTKNGRDIASWWADRLNISSRADYENGLFTDQKWWDLSQIYFQNTGVIKNDGWNMAPWNVSERRLISLDPPRLDSGEDLFFFHFSKYPSRAFNEKIYSQTTSNLLDELVRQYSLSFSASQEYIDELLIRVNALVKLMPTSIKLIPKKSPNAEIFLTSLLLLLSKSTTLRRVINNNRPFKKIAKYVYKQIHKMIYRIELVSNHLSDLSTLDKVKLDLLIITHQGGGGVGEVVRERVQECVGLGKSVGVLKANQAGDMILSLRNFSIAINLDVDFSRLLAQALEIEIHHILGLENLLDEVSKHRIDTIYLHDKYFITQRPFADTLKYISVPRDTSGINSPLNRHSNYGDDAWLQKTRKILLNSTSLRAPSNYLIEEYRLVIPELKIEKIDIESNLVPIRRNHPFTDIGNIVLISPTGAHKGGTILAQVAKIFEYDRPSTMFRVFGDLDILTEEALKKLQNVTLHGQVSRPRLNNALVTSGPSLGWIPSLTGESYSLALSDFLSNGIAVIAANTGALRERLTEVPGNYLYDPAIPAEVLANLIIAIMEDKDLDEFLPHFQFT